MSKKSSAKRKKFFRDFKYLILNPFTWGYAIIFVILVIATSVVYKSETLTESGIETVWDLGIETHGRFYYIEND